MSFRSPEPDDELDDSESLAGAEAPTHLSLHHHVPLKFGGTTADGLLSLKLPAVSIEEARRPVSPGMPPQFMPPLFHPDSVRLLPPPGAQAPSLRSGMVAAIAAERPAFSTAPRADLLRPGPSAAPSVRPAEGMAATIGQIAPSPDLEAPTRPALGDRVDPVIAFFFYLALAVGFAWAGGASLTFLRYTTLWTVLVALGIGLRLVDEPRPLRAMTSGDLLWGLGIGFIVALPLLIAVRPGLVEITNVLLPELDAAPPAYSFAMLFQSTVLIAPLAETIFFRGAIQDRHGIGASIRAAGANNIALYVPFAFSGELVLTAVAILYLTGLAGVYSFVRRQYGISAALICQMMVNLMLLFVPVLMEFVFIATRTP